MHLVVAVLAGQPEVRARVADALRGEARVIGCARVDDLRQLLGGPVDCIILEPWDVDGCATAPAVVEIKRLLPSVGIVAYCDPSPRTCRELLSLSRAGIDDVALRGADDLAPVLGRLLTRAGAREVSSVVIAAIASVHPSFSIASPCAAVVRHCAEHASRATSVSVVARQLGMHRRTLANRLAAGALPLPAELIAWCRLLAAARLLREPGRTVERVGISLGFGSGAGLRNMFRRRAELSPSNARTSAGWTRLVERFTEALVRSRDEARFGLGVRRAQVATPVVPRLPGRPCPPNMQARRVG